ncbi:Tryptophan-rich sensory protein [Balamuthia mandrillaris]
MAAESEVCPQTRSTPATPHFFSAVAFLAAMLAGHFRWGGNSIADISEKYPSLLTPVGWAFAIWTVIYLSLAVYFAWQLLPSNRSNVHVQGIVKFVTLAAIFQAAWVVAWCNEYLVLAAVYMVGIWVSLFVVNATLRPASLLLKLPFGLWFGWITVATLINIGIVGDVAFHAPFFRSAAWGMVALSIAMNFSWIVGSGLCARTFPLSIGWACYGIYKANNDPTVTHFAFVASIVMAVYIAAMTLSMLCCAFLSSLTSSNSNEEDEERLEEGELDYTSNDEALLLPTKEEEEMMFQSASAPASVEMLPPQIYFMPPPQQQMQHAVLPPFSAPQPQGNLYIFNPYPYAPFQQQQEK